MGGKNPPEARAYVSARAEDGRRGHGVADAGFWNPTPGRPREPMAGYEYSSL